MPGRRKALSDRAPVVATLLVPLSLLGQGCERQRPAGPVVPAKSPEATVDDASARPKTSAPKAEEGRSSAAPESGPVEATVVTDASFADFTAAGVRLVDFWSPGCPPCRVQGPIVEKLAKDFTGRAAIGKLRVDLNRAAPGRFGIMYIPTLIVFKDGEEVRRLTGLQNEATLTAAVEEALRGK